MDTITLEKPNGTKFQVNDRRSKKPQANFQRFKSGYVGNDNEEKLLPTGMQSNEEKDKPEGEETLYPTGINPK